MVIMLMMNVMTIMTMMMILMMILDDDTDDDIYITAYKIYKIPKAPFRWVPDLGTSPGHEPIIGQSCGALLFFSCRSNRDLSGSNIPGPIQWI